MKNPLSANQIVARALTNTRKVALCCSATKCLESGVFLDGFLKFLEEICFTFLGMDEVGIYRLSGATSEVRRLKEAFDNSK